MEMTKQIKHIIENHIFTSGAASQDHKSPKPTNILYFVMTDLSNG